MSALILAALIVGASVKPEVTTAEQLKAAMGQQAVVFGIVERVNIRKGKGEWQGTALVLDDDTVIYVSYGEPPDGWAALVGQRVRAEGQLSTTASDHAQSMLAPHLRPGPTPVKDSRAVSSLIERRVRLCGLAKNAKGGAVLLVDGSVLYVASLESWPAGLDGKTVAVGGKLVSRQYLPEATRGPKGEISQGASGTQLVLESPVWRAVSAEGAGVVK